MLKVSTIEKSAKAIKSKMEKTNTIIWICVCERDGRVILNVFDVKQASLVNVSFYFLFAQTAVYATSNHGNELQRLFVSISKKIERQETGKQAQFEIQYTGSFSS